MVASLLTGFSPLFTPYASKAFEFDLCCSPLVGLFFTPLNPSADCSCSLGFIHLLNNYLWSITGTKSLLSEPTVFCTSVTVL